MSEAAAVTIEPPATGALPLTVERPTHFTEVLRPSSLPKLAQCPRYMPSSEAGPFAERGNKLDRAFRLLFAGDPSALDGCTEEESKSLKWAKDMTILLSGGEEIHTEKDDCRMSIPDLPNGGEADAIVPTRFRSMDLKSGMLREYREQMAAYAYGLMLRHFTEEWTCSLLFLDLREVVHMRFTFEEAKGIVEAVIASKRDPESLATPGGACGWCAFKEVCQARLNLAAESLAALHLKEGLEALKDDPEKLARFIVGCNPLEDMLKSAKEHAKSYFDNGGPGVPGFKLQSRKGNEFVSPVDVLACFPGATLEEICGYYGEMSGTKFRLAWTERRGSQEAPENLIQSKPGSTFIKAAPPPKEPKAKKPKARK
ncbi:PD-(D/E)XK nuclease family protein [Verrucomicrobium sp. BvORR106]|uniref:PD-(D/E)XK nuclease family protein n=1 Tax=Verrucomicrobium sp. BvORR106 TaxID=1403819 RepID=UPI00056EFB5A|nr:PD-(D/E)XK nuclease family protein [Verrucomicrobium sp. BvORR106]